MPQMDTSIIRWLFKVLEHNRQVIRFIFRDFFFPFITVLIIKWKWNGINVILLGLAFLEWAQAGVSPVFATHMFTRSGFHVCSFSLSSMYPWPSLAVSLHLNKSAFINSLFSASETIKSLMHPSIFYELLFFSILQNLEIFLDVYMVNRKWILIFGD